MASPTWQAAATAVCVAAASVRNSSVPAAPVIAICAGPAGPSSRVVHTGSAGRPSSAAALVHHPFDAVDVLDSRRIQVGVDRGDQLVLVGVALRQAHVHAAGREISDGGADRADALAATPDRCGRRRCRLRLPELDCQPRAAAAAGSGSSGRRRRPAAPPERRRTASAPCRARWPANEHMPSTPASTMQASTSGAIDQNMSRPSCSSRGFAGLGAGCGWVVIVASIPGPKGRTG